MSVLVHLKQFEGPLDLLLYLIRKQEMDILDIEIHLITQEYLEYIRRMKQLDLEVASDFIAMAATLIQIKSRMLLPNYDENGEEVEADDPRKELVNRLLEYQKFQEISKKLYERPLLGRDLWLRGKKEKILQESAEDDIIIEDNGLFSLISAYRWIVRNMTQRVHRVYTRVQSIASRILEIRTQLQVGCRVLYRDLITTTGPERRTQGLVTLLSLLELGRLGFVGIFQAEPCGDIHIEPRREISQDVITRVKDFEAENTEAVAAAILQSSAMDEMDNTEVEVQPATDEEIAGAEQALGIQVEMEPPMGHGGEQGEMV